MSGKALLQEIRGSPVNFVPAKGVVSPHPGEWTSPFEGKGYEARAYRDFEIGDNPRRIHLPTTARRNVPTIVERVALRDFKLMVVVDASPSMNVRNKQTIQLEAAVLLLYSAWQAEMTFGLAVQTAQGIRSRGIGIGSRHFYRLYRTLRAVLGMGGESRAGGSGVHLSRCLPPNSMLLYCSDFLDSHGGLSGLPSLIKAARRLDFIPLIVQDELEYSFPQTPHGSFVPFCNPETGACDDLWVSGRAAQEIRALYEARFREIVGIFDAAGLKFVSLDSPGVTDIGKRINAFFRRRKRSKSG